MAPFLPIQASDRSQNVRVGGQKVNYGVTTYVDLGNLGIVPVKPTLSSSEVGKNEVEGIEKEEKLLYSVIALDAFGGETTQSASTEIESGKGKNEVGKSNYNEITVEWTAVYGATEYRVIRAKVSAPTKWFSVGTTKATKLVDKVNKPAEFTVPTVNNTYVANKTNVNPRYELNHHNPINSYLVVGPLTASNLDWAPIVEEAPWALTLESEKVKVAKAKELRQRSTGNYQTAEVAAASLTGIVSEANKEKYVAVVYNSLNNKVEAVTGANEAEASVAAVLAKIAPGQQLLYLLNTIGTTKTVTNVTSSLPNPPVVARV